MPRRIKWHTQNSVQIFWMVLYAAYVQKCTCSHQTLWDNCTFVVFCATAAHVFRLVLHFPIQYRTRTAARACTTFSFMKLYIWQKLYRVWATTWHFDGIKTAAWIAIRRPWLGTGYSRCWLNGALHLKCQKQYLASSNGMVSFPCALVD